MTTPTLATRIRPVASWRSSVTVGAPLTTYGPLGAPASRRPGEGRTPGLAAPARAGDSGRALQRPDAGAQLPDRRDLTGAGAVATPGSRDGEPRTRGGGSGATAQAPTTERTSLFDIGLTALLTLAGFLMLTGFLMQAISGDWAGAILPLVLAAVAYTAVRVLWAAIDEQNGATT